jgi:hypothetical protein
MDLSNHTHKTHNGAVATKITHEFKKFNFKFANIIKKLNTKINETIIKYSFVSMAI